MNYEIKICHLYPDLLNLYGDRGNIMALTKRCEWRGIRAGYLPVTLGDPFRPEDCDIILIGGGQDYEQAIIQDDLMEGKRDAIKEAVQAGKVILAICGGLQLLGKYFKTHKGELIECIGALDLWTVGSSERLTGNLVFECDFLKNDSFNGLVVGFENHSGKTYRGSDVKPLGKVVVGFGSNGEDGYEGAVYKNTFCSYSHGSLLPKNPALTDHLLTLALKNKYEDFEALEKLDDSFEARANESLIRRFMSAKYSAR
jgi:CobQ-like glutamine amidotransferase family enzyme